MPSYRIESATFSSEWKFNSILPELPTPGSKGFTALILGLQPFGLTAKGISLQTPTNNLNDVRLDLILSNPRATIGIGYSYITLDTGEIYDGEPITLLQIMQVVFTAMAEIDPKVEQGKGIARVNLQLPLLDEQTDTFLARYVKKQDGDVYIAPDAAAFIVKYDEVSQQARTRAVFAKSAYYDNALFCEITWEHESGVNGKPMEFLSRLDTRELNILTAFDLHNSEKRS